MLDADLDFDFVHEKKFTLGFDSKTDKNRFFGRFKFKKSLRATISFFIASNLRNLCKIAYLLDFIW